ncbi:tRNA pseudouridine(38-40) synthase TruA [Effusibacillus lacus]|uniref:tRNA pseudouridine synthase A n=1 Tax=Effusibacillus lacus TaxID=1348429 RepID=A0A292YK53_9BACL|nr:tRNA pseudouridine(38-40) synthase TruA [Effusibacillus lacus]TCS69204.1 tRNA pseudouridine38-40 synthase [Effusibacillus lacus]GAX89291.1 tRNA pseudouridine(38-40) synthase TruA [Effusibacillus lacus]
MRNIKLTIAYDGTDFHGFQAQPQLRTVQGTLEDALERLTGARIQVNGSGRTDAGVHAWGQIVNFHTDSRIPLEKWPIAMNVNLPNDVIVRQAEEVPPAFHARFDATGKVYRYQMDLGTYPDVFARRYAWHVPYRLNLSRMQKAAEHLVGSHDFTSFCNAATPVDDKVREIHGISFETRAHLLQITVTGSGFLWNMVRIMAGTLADVGRGRIEPEEIPEILAAKDRTKAGVTAPAHGLTLFEVIYPKV